MEDKYTLVVDFQKEGKSEQDKPEAAKVETHLALRGRGHCSVWGIQLSEKGECARRIGKTIDLDVEMKEEEPRQ